MLVCITEMLHYVAHEQHYWAYQLPLGVVSSQNHKTENGRTIEGQQIQKKYKSVL